MLVVGRHAKSVGTRTPTLSIPSPNINRNPRTVHLATAVASLLLIMWTSITRFPLSKGISLPAVSFLCFAVRPFLSVIQFFLRICPIKLCLVLALICISISQS
ncbi:hypothetical protein BJ878DRAFT_494220 [Calycina marina]|uniref:Uncharacterized protein n=1 Tax=Calycina marina TaxID=1763456 RepID=A0A9P7Z886_9HELO|nr:hypothetical protein BJ878DRAFT_494220 [Calycina marina]